MLTLMHHLVFWAHVIPAMFCSDTIYATLLWLFMFPGMLNEYTAQRLEMTALLAELNSLEGQLDALLGALNLLDPEDTTCIQ